MFFGTKHLLCGVLISAANAIAAASIYNDAIAESLGFTDTMQYATETLDAIYKMQ